MIRVLWLVGAALVLGGAGLVLADVADPHTELRSAINEAGVTPLNPNAASDPDLIALGQALFFDPELSGNRDTSCATCHHPAIYGVDRLSLSIGTGGRGFGEGRVLATARFHVPRNAPELWNRGAEEWTTMFWDARVEHTGSGVVGDGREFDSELGVLAVQAIVTIASPVEMRGFPGDVDIFGNLNELAFIPPEDIDDAWNGVMDRLVAIDGYVDLFDAAFPGEEPTIGHVGTAIAAFESVAFASTGSPFDQYLAGNDDALTEPQLRGAALFFGDAACATCHSGPLLTDQQSHTLAVPQLGPGKGDAAPDDLGRSVISGDPADAYAFRTPPLRNVVLSPPYMHDGAYFTLSEVVRHHLDPLGSYQTFDISTVRVDMAEAGLPTADQLDRMRPTLDFTPARELSETEIAELVVFLEALTDPDALDLTPWVPNSVPSGLPVGGVLSR